MLYFILLDKSKVVKAKNMKILPSLLEYSEAEIIKKIGLLASKSPAPYDLHLDFVFQEFARDRSVMASLTPKTVFTILEIYFAKKKCNLTIHLMGDLSDLEIAWKFFDKYQFNSKWDYLIFVPPNNTNLWSNLSSKHKNLKTGIWLDLDKWMNLRTTEFQEFFSQNKEITNYLIMTVMAGKSGQKLLELNKNKAIELVKENPNLNFILDGGWSTNLSYDFNNLSVVSYTDFWKKFL
jgi:pentose-5-phosphate-3-epimerase